MYLSKNLRLTIWNLGSDTYDHTRLAANFDLIDEHDHTPTKGNRLGTESLKDWSITTPKLADNSVTPSKIPDGSIGNIKLADDSVDTAELVNNSVSTPKIQDKSVTSDKLADDIVPVGIIVPWFRKSVATPIPQGWALCEGQPWSTVPNDLGMGVGNLPDLRNRFILGASSTGGSNTPDSPPAEGYRGGRHTVNLAHGHYVGNHTHSVPDHLHPIAVQAAHKHRFWSKSYNASGNPVSSFLTDAAQRNTAVPSSNGDRQSLFIPNLNVNSVESSTGGGVAAPMGPDEYPSGVQHNHGGATGPADRDLTTNAGGAGNTTENLGTTDIRPAYIGLLHIMRVKK